MYKAFLSSQQKNGTKSEIEKVQPEVKEKVLKIWKEIEETNPYARETNENGKKEKCENDKNVKSMEWKIVRLFVSSTFNDFFNEREALVKRVFPELREWCRDQNLRLIECDLRWGVPRDTPSKKTVSICLEEIDKCIEVSDGSPLFIGLLGDRYGWIPTEEDISPEVREKYGWVFGTSITSMEILHGAYRTGNPNAAFFLRNPSVYSEIPQSHVHYFVEEAPLAAYHLKVLKEKINTAFPGQVFKYEPRFKQMSTAASGDRAIVEMEGYEEFAANALKFFKSAITRMHPNQRKQSISSLDEARENRVTCQIVLNTFDREDNAQRLYMVEKGSNLIGRLKEKAILIGYLTQGEEKHFEKTDGAKSQMRKLEDWDVSGSYKPLCVVEAASGWGKTTLISSVIQDVVTRKSDWQVFYHLVGCTPSSVQPGWLLHRLLTVLIPDPSDEDKLVMKDEKWEDQKKLLNRALTDFHQQESRKLIIIIDNVNSLSNSDSVNHLSWLPPMLPPNIRCVVSTNQHLPTTARLFEHATIRLCLATMTREELADIATHYLGTFSKKLHPSQLDALMTSTKVDNPLWLTLMVEELRVFGSFSEMDRRIAELPTSLKEFLVQVFERLVKEDQSQGLVEKVLCLTACSQYGLPSDNVLQICGNVQSKEPVALLDWLQVKRSLAPYLRMRGVLEEDITFSHDQVHKAVLDHFLPKESDFCRWHTVLADFYQFWCVSGRTRMHNLIYHLRKARLLHRIVKVMRTDKHSYFHVPIFRRSEYLKDCRCRMLADPVIPGNLPIMLCHVCSNKSYGFNPGAGWQNKTCCVICGHKVSGKCPVYAHACMKHAQRRGADMVKCVLCNAAVKFKGNNSSGLAPSPALLCDFCSFGMGGKSCAVLSCDRR